MKFLLQFVLSFYSLSTLRFKGMCPGTSQKERISLFRRYFNGIVNNTEIDKMCHLGVLCKYCRKYECILFCKYVLIVCHEHLQMEITFGYSWDTRSVACDCT